MLKQLILLGVFYSAYSKSISNPAICENQNTGFFVTDNSILKSEDSIVYKDTSEEECLHLCSHNRDKFGRSILCSSFSYDHAKFSCTVYKEKSSPVGSASLESAVGKRYFEKICLPSKVPTQCAEAQFIRVDQSVLVGYATNLTLVDNIELCVAQCVQEKNCLSAMYFYEDGECITNKESALTKPAAFSKEENDRVIYFQNGCDLNKIPVVEKDTVVSTEASGTSETDTTEEEESEVEDKVKVDVEPVTQVSETTPKVVEEVVEDEVKTENGEQVTSDDESEYEEEGENAVEEAEEVVEEEEVTDAPTTTTTSSTTQAPKKSFSRKIRKHPKNFGSKTYKALKRQKTLKLKNSKELAEEESDIVEVYPNRRNLKIKKVAEEEFENEETVYFSEWSDWTPCTKSQERQIRRRRCLNLRKCLGALMQVQNCPIIVSTTQAPESIRSVVGVDGEEYDDPIPINSKFQVIDHASTQPPQLLNEQTWGPWQGTCQNFASSQPCNNGNMIGFESRECIAKDPVQCEGPFFRYCTLSC